MDDGRANGTTPGADRWNFAANVMDGAFFSLGLSFVSQQTILPVIVKHIGGGNIAVGLIPVIWTLGFNFFQMLIVPRTRRTRRKKALLLVTTFLQRIPWLFLCIASFFMFGVVPAQAAIFVFFLLFGMAAAGGSLSVPVWFDLVAKLTPVNRRGRLFGYRSILGSVLGLVGGGVAAEVLGALEPPMSYSILFALTFCAMMASYLSLAALKVPEGGEREAGHPRRVGDATPIQLLRRDRNLRNFLVADALQMSANMGVAFFAVHAIVKFSLPDAAAGTFTEIMMGSMIAGSLIFGPMADRFGHKLNLMVAALSTLVSGAAAVVAPDPLTYSIVFVGVALTTGLISISRLPLLAELSGESERPAIIAIVNTVTSPFVFWGVLGGVIADAMGYEAVFGLSALFAASGLIWLAVMVNEPRQRPVYPRSI